METQTEPATLPDLGQLAAAELPQVVSPDPDVAPSVADTTKEYQVAHANGEVHTGTLKRAEEICPFIAGLLARMGTAETTKKLAMSDMTAHLSAAERLAARGRARRMAAEETTATRLTWPTPVKEKPTEPVVAIPISASKEALDMGSPVPYTPLPPEARTMFMPEQPEQLLAPAHKREIQPQPIIMPEQHVPQAPLPPPTKQERPVLPAVVAAGNTAPLAAIESEKSIALPPAVTELQPEIIPSAPAITIQSKEVMSITEAPAAAPPEREDEDLARPDELPLLPAEHNAYTETTPEVPPRYDAIVQEVEEIFAEWLETAPAATLPEQSDEAVVPTESNTAEITQAIEMGEEPQAIQPTGEIPFETRTAVHAILEQMAGIVDRIAAPQPRPLKGVGTQNTSATEADQVSPDSVPLAIETEAAVQQLEPLCAQLLEALGLYAEPDAVRVLARHLAFMVRSDQPLLQSAEKATANAYVDLGTHERKRSIIAVVQLHVSQAMQQLQRFLTAGRYILASMASLRPNTA